MQRQEGMFVNSPSRRYCWVVSGDEKVRFDEGAVRPAEVENFRKFCPNGSNSRLESGGNALA